MSEGVHYHTSQCTCNNPSSTCYKGCSCGKSTRYCGCDCKEKSKEHNCKCNSTCSCGCGQTYWGDKVDKYVLVGFNKDGLAKVIDSYTGHKDGEGLVLRRADRATDNYSGLHVIMYDRNRNPIACKPICFDPPVPTKSKARLC